MTHSNHPVLIDNETGDILNEEELANQAAADLFGNEKNAQKTSGTLRIAGTLATCVFWLAIIDIV